MFGKIQLLGILLQRHGKDYAIEEVSGECQPCEKLRKKSSEKLDTVYII